MKQFSKGMAIVLACSASALTTYAGGDQIESKEMKQVAPMVAPVCNWTGFYLGVNAGGEFGHSETKDLDDWYYTDRPWGYSQSSFVAGGQVGYNWQWQRLVIGPEFDVGYLDVDGSGREPGDYTTPYGHTKSDFYATFRGRVGVALGARDQWLLYATGGAIGLNFESRFTDPEYDTDYRKTDFDWGYCLGGGAEWRLNCHWSIKAEYLYFAVDKQEFSGLYDGETTYRFNADSMGHIVRAGINYHF